MTYVLTSGKHKRTKNRMKRHKDIRINQANLR